MKKFTDGWSIANWSIDGLAKLDSDGHSPSQTQAKKVVRVLDHEEGSASRRWAALDFGVIVESHGDHSCIRFGDTPGTIHSLTDSAEGGCSYA